MKIDGRCHGKITHVGEVDRSKTKTLFLLAPLLLVASACHKSKPKPPLEKMYCEGGISNDGRSNSDQCIVIELNGASTGVIGTARLSQRYQEQFEIQMTAPSKYTLLKDGKKAGAVDQRDNWITVTVDDPKYEKSMRCDAPGVFE